MRAAPGDDATLPELFWAVARRLRHLSQENLSQWDISPSQSRALLVLSRHGQLRLSELSDHLRIAPRSATEVVDALEEKSLLKRQADPSDRRATLVTLTESGPAHRRGHAGGTSQQYCRPVRAAVRDRSGPPGRHPAQIDLSAQCLSPCHPLVGRLRPP